MLQPSKLQESKRNAEGILQDLQSTGATKRKMDFVGDCDARPCDGTDNPRADDTFTIVSLECLNELFCAVMCKVCGGDVNFSKGEREFGLAVKLCRVCELRRLAVSMELAAHARQPKDKSVRRKHPCHARNAKYRK